MTDEKLPLFDLNLAVYIEPKGHFQGLQTHIIGMKAPDFLVLDRPSPSDMANLEINASYWVRYFQNTVFRFKSKILKIIDEPTPLILIEYPHSAEEITFRGSERKKVFIRGEFLDLPRKGRGSPWDGYLIDISESGCQVIGDIIHLLNHDNHLSFRIPQTHEEIHAKARVVHCEVTERGTRSGLKFIDLDPDTQNRLKAFIDSLMEKQFSQMEIQEQSS